MVVDSYWASLKVSADIRSRVAALAVDAEARRAQADYNTGSILESEACLLAVLSERLKARTIIEVGTFIGMSTTALALGSAVESVYTCDGSNDCLPATTVIRTYPKRTSTHMLRDMGQLGVSADLCFFDGVLQQADSSLLRGLVHDQTVYAFHDYNYGPKVRCRHGRQFMETVPRKGIGNVGLLQPWLSNHRLVEPLPDTTLALLVPA
jgi:predicted O-methyltransferase YrrM